MSNRAFETILMVIVLVVSIGSVTYSVVVA